MFVMHIAGYKHFPDFFTIYYTIYWLPSGMLEWVCIQHPVGSLLLIGGNLVKYLYLEVTANNWFRRSLLFERGLGMAITVTAPVGNRPRLIAP